MYDNMRDLILLMSLILPFFAGCKQGGQEVADFAEGKNSEDSVRMLVKRYLKREEREEVSRKC